MCLFWGRKAERLTSGVSGKLRCNTLYFAVVVLLSAWLLPFNSASAQIQTPPSHAVAVNLDSGPVVNNGNDMVILWSDIVQVDGAQWLRLYFNELHLPEEPVTHSGSILRITSMLDGATQTLDAESARQWGMSSAYFNGDAVSVELLVLPDGMENRVVIDSVVIGDSYDEEGVESICDKTDNRVLNDDKAVGRGLPAGCTAWIFNDANHNMLTAGHCSRIGNDVIEFNVPLSKKNGTIVHPGPEDQYAVDPESQQFDDKRMGEDWSYFGCFPNSETGLTPYQAQGEFYELDFPKGPIPGDKISLPGFGTVSPPVDPRWNQVEKIMDGPYWSFSGTIVGYRTDSSGGNSGSPVVFEPTGKAIGIHTHGGCADGSGHNSGTGINNEDLQEALDNPKGVCAGEDCINLAIDHLKAGRWADLTVSKGTAGETVTVLWSLSLGTYQHDGTNWCVDFGLDIPDDKVKMHLAAQGAFDEDGQFEQEIFISDQFKGKAIAFQAAVQNTCPNRCMSGIVETFVE